MPWSASWRPRPSWPDPATRFCWLRDVPPWTCSPTTRSAGTRSRKPYAAGSDRAGPQGRNAMTTADPFDDAPRRRNAVVGWYAAVRGALDRPLTAYYLLLGASALLLTIGLIMVLSASSVYSYQQNGNSYAVVERQLLWVLIGIPCAWIASRLPHAFLRRFAWLALIVSIVLLALTQLGLGRTVNGNTNWLGVGPFVVQPAEIAKLSIVLWAA